MSQEYHPKEGQRALPHCCHRPGTYQDAAGHAQESPIVSVLVDQVGRATFGHLLRCGSVWTCPVCASRIALERSDLLRELLRLHMRQQLLDGSTPGALFITYTIRHELHDRLKDLRRSLIRGATKQLRQSYTWKQLQRSGYLGDVRTIEVTVGPHFGWHPHLHQVVVLDHAPTETERLSLEDALFAEWKRACIRAGLPAPLRWAVQDDGSTKALGVNVSIIDPGADVDAVADYMASGAVVSASAETTQWMAKEARSGNRGPMQLLEDLADRRDKRDAALWLEYAAAMRGARQFEWSRGRWDLRARYGLRDREDAEIAADDQEEEKTPVAEIGGGVFRRFARVKGWKWRVLELAEEGGGLAVLEFVTRCINTFRDRSPPDWYRKEVLCNSP